MKNQNKTLVKESRNMVGEKCIPFYLRRYLQYHSFQSTT